MDLTRCTYPKIRRTVFSRALTASGVSICGVMVQLQDIHLPQGGLRGFEGIHAPHIIPPYIVEDEISETVVESVLQPRAVLNVAWKLVRHCKYLLLRLMCDRGPGNIKDGPGTRDYPQALSPDAGVYPRSPNPEEANRIGFKLIAQCCSLPL